MDKKNKGNSAILKKSILIIQFFLFIIFKIQSFSFDTFYINTIKFERISTKNGLSSNSIFNISQDSKGFLWISTGNGLNRFDGYSAKVFKSIKDDSTTLSDNRILVTLEDRDGYLWIGTMQGGINRYNKFNQQVKRYPFNLNLDNTIKGERVFTIFEDSRGMIWVGTSSGLFMYRKSGDDFINKSTFCFGENKTYTVRCIKEDKKGNLWIGTSNGLFVIDSLRKRVTSFNTSNSKISNNFINSITFDNNNIIYIATEKGVNILNYSDKKFAYLIHSNNSNSVISNLINSVLIDQSGYLWIGTNRGLDIYNPHTKTFQHFTHNPDNSNSISFNYITNIFEDASGNIWISTFSGGINKLPKIQKNIITFPSKIINKYSNSNMVVSFNEIDSQNILIGTYDGLGLFNISKGIFTPYYKKDEQRASSISSCIVSIAKESNRGYWLGTLSKGLVKFDIISKKTITYTPNTTPAINDWNVNTLAFDKDRVLWIGTISGGIAKYNSTKNMFIQYHYDPSDLFSISSNRIKIIFIDSKNNVWIGTEKGLNLFDRAKNNFKKFLSSNNDPYSISDDFVTSITEDNDGNIWIGTFSGGLNKFELNTQRFIHYKNKYLPLGYQIKSLIVDNQNCLWIASNNGLFRYDIKNDLLSAFDESDGLTGNEFLESANFKLSNGKIIFGSHNFFSIINPINIFKKEKNYNILITDFKIFGKSISTLKDISEVNEINLTYKENYFTIEFASLDLRNSNKINYSYKMEGLDNNWIDCGKRRYVSYMNLKGNTYFFKIRASRNDGSWYESSLPLKITIDSPPWERWYAFLFYIAFLIGIMTTIIKVRTRIQNQKIESLKEKEKILSESKQALTNLIRRFTQLQEEERSYISRELHDGINQTIASIKLGVDKLRLDKNTPKHMINDLETLENHLKQIIQDIRNISQNLRPSLLDDFGLLSAIHNLCDDFKNKTNIDILIKSSEFDTRLDYEIESNLYRIIQEILNNVRKHSGATKVTIEFKNLTYFYEIVITDNGKGFDTSNIFTPEFIREHFGLNNIKKRAELIGANIIIDSALGSGTKIIITLPIK